MFKEIPDVHYIFHQNMVNWITVSLAKLQRIFSWIAQNRELIKQSITIPNWINELVMIGCWITFSIQLGLTLFSSLAVALISLVLF